MSSEWAMLSLGELAGIKHGWAFKSDFFSESPKENPIVVGIGNFKYEGGFRFENTKIKYYEGDFPSDYLLEAGDILLVMTCQTAGGEILGIPGKIPGDNKKYLHNQRLGKFINKKRDLLDDDYAYHLFKSADFNRFLASSASGTKILHTSPDRILQYSLELPPVSEQKAIAHILGTLDDKIELNHKTNETLEAMAKALFKSWFVDFDPVRAKAEGRPTGLPAEISDLFPDSFEDSELGEIPNGWSISCVSDICETTDYVANGSFESLKQNVERVDAFSGSEALLLRFTDFNRDWKGDFSFITRESFEFLSKSKVLPGDVVICNVGEVGAFFRAPNLNLPMSLGPNSVLFKDFESKSHLTREYFFFLIGTNAFQANISAISSGSVQTKFNKTSLRAVPVLLPSNTLIRISSDFFESILSKVDSLFCKTRTLVDLRDALLPKLISGEIRIPDAERLLEEVGV